MLKIPNLKKKIGGFFPLNSCGMHSALCGIWDLQKSGLCLLAVAGRVCKFADPAWRCLTSQGRSCPEWQACISWEGAEEI